MRPLVTLPLSSRGERMAALVVTRQKVTLVTGTWADVRLRLGWGPKCLGACGWLPGEAASAGDGGVLYE